MGILENLGFIALSVIVGVFVGRQWLSKPRVGNVTEVEHEAEVARSATHEANKQALDNVTSATKQRTEEVNRVGASNILADMIKRGEISK